MEKVIIGTRASQLARCQTELITDRLTEYHSDTEVEIKTISTAGDRLKDEALYKYGGKGLFIKEIEAALLQEEIDIAVHSLKDVPGEMPDRFCLACFPPREDARDILISREYDSLEEMPEGSTLGTGSLRRKIQLKQKYPGLEFVNMRGNVDTRISKMEEQELAGIILAAAGLHRLGWQNKITEYISPSICVPAAGQGTLGIEILKDRQELIPLVAPLNCRSTELACIMERSIMEEMGGSCDFPLGIKAQFEKEKQEWTYQVRIFLADKQGKKSIRKKQNGKIKKEVTGRGMLEVEVEKMARQLAREILEQGGKKIIVGLE